MTRPIFFDPTGRRGLWARRSLATGLIAILIAALAFATTLIEVPAGSALALPLPRGWSVSRKGIIPCGLGCPIGWADGAVR